MGGDLEKNGIKQQVLSTFVGLSSWSRVVNSIACHSLATK